MEMAIKQARLAICLNLHTCIICVRTFEYKIKFIKKLSGP